MGKFTKKLDENYKFQKEFNDQSINKLEYLGNTIFDFTTYDSAIDALLAEKMLPVLKSIVDRTTFEYQECSEEQYLNYLLMVNMPFLVDKLEWGTSIRGAWLDEFQEYEIDCGRIKIKKGELNEFVKDLIDWIDN